MKTQFRQPKLRQATVEDYQKRMGRDLRIAFQQNYDSTQRLLHTAAREKWTLEELFRAIEDL